MGQELAFAPPRAEEMTKTVVSLGSGVVTGLAEGVIISLAPALGALGTPLTWMTLLGVPAVGVGGALFTRGMIGDVFQGIAGAGAGILGYSLPALMKPFLPAGARLGGGPGVKQLPAGSMYAPQMAQQQARVGSSLEF